MKRLKHCARMLVALLLTLFCLSAQSQSDKQVWGLLKGSSSQGETSWLVKFPLNDPASYEKTWGFTSNYVTSGCLVDGIYYYFETVQQVYGYDCVGMMALDTETGKVVTLKDYSTNPRSTGAICSPTYDYSTGTMYAINGLQGGYNLSIIDIETGVISQGPTFNGVEQAQYGSSLYDDYFKNIAVNVDGDMYGVTYWGYLYTINQNTGDCMKIGKLDCISAQSGAMQYLIGDLTFDNETNELYLWRWDFYEPNTLYLLNPTTATSTAVASLTRDHQLGEMCIPFVMADDDAPDEVTDFTMTPGENGANFATLEWDNPSSTFGGDRLGSIDYVALYRNGEEIKKWENPTVGGHMTYTDENLESGFYTYRLNAFNEAGKGKGSTRKGYIGRDIPSAPADFKAVSAGSDVELTWTAPTVGALGGWIDAANMTYNIKRNGALLTEGVTSTSFTDNTIEQIARFQYAIEAVTPDGKSREALSDYVIGGPAFEVPHTFSFYTNEDCYTWQNINADGGYGYWGLNNWPPTLTGLKNAYAYDDIIPEDWLISPNIALKAGKHYKVMFDATPGNADIPELLNITFGQGATIEDQELVDQLEIIGAYTQRVRMNLPVPEADGEYNFGLVHVTPYKNYSIVVQNISIEEDHEGYIAGVLTNAEGEPIANATVIAAGGRYQSKTNENGEYKLFYLAPGQYNVCAIALGYYDQFADVEVTELETAIANFTMVALPEHTVTGKAIDRAGDPVANATVFLAGYNYYTTTTDANGEFEIANVFDSQNYTLGIMKNRMKGYTVATPVQADVQLGDITLEEDIRPASRLSVEATDAVATVKWHKPANDPVQFNHDTGEVYNYVNIQGGNDSSLFGQIFREGASVQQISWFLINTGTTHYSVNVFVFPLDENGVPTTQPVFKQTYVTNTDNQWSSYYLPQPLDMPNGFMVAISNWDAGSINLARDNGPCVKNTSCYKMNYADASEAWHYLESNNIDANFLIRAYGVPYDDEEAAPAPRFIAKEVAPAEACPWLIDTELPEAIQAGSPVQKARVIDDHITYNVYRMLTSDLGNNGKYEKIAEGLKAYAYEDKQWAGLAQGSYCFGVEAVYYDTDPALIVYTDSIGKDMESIVKIHLNTNTPTNESEGAWVSIFNADHYYGGAADADGNVNITDATGNSKVWKGNYTLTINLAGFAEQEHQVTIDQNETSLEYTLTEIQVQPEDLQIIEDETDKQTRTFVWDWPDLLFDGFEDHDNFAINSPGEIGWQYIDGDGDETMGFSACTWPGMYDPSAWMVFNASATDPSIAGYNLMDARSGSKCLASFGCASGINNDDWFISPRLYFQEDFRLRFAVRATDAAGGDSYRVGYSRKSIEREDFEWLTDTIKAGTYYLTQLYDVPADAKYVAIVHCNANGHALLIDDVNIGLNLGWYMPPFQAAKMPAEQGQYEYYIDDEATSAFTDDIKVTISNIPGGNHVFGVRACYTSGNTPWTTGEFTVDGTTGINDVNIDDANAILYDLSGKRVANPTQRGVYIQVTNNGAKKVVK